MQRSLKFHGVKFEFHWSPISRCASIEKYCMFWLTRTPRLMTISCKYA